MIISELLRLIEDKKVTVSVPFNGYESELGNLKKAGIEVMARNGKKPSKDARGLDIPIRGGGGNTEINLQGSEKDIRKYLAKLWHLDADSEEINELFGSTTPVFEASKLNMSKATVVKLASGDAGVELQGEVFGIRNDNPIVAFMLEAMGVPMDGLAIKIRSGFMQYDQKSKMLFIARYKSDLPNKRSEKIMSPLNEALKAAGLPLREEFDPGKTSTEARNIAKAIKDQFHVPVDLKNNKDGSITVTVNNGHLSPESEGRNPHVITPKNLSKVIDEPYRTYRQKGWFFSQPTRGSFTIGVKQ